MDKQLQVLFVDDEKSILRTLERFGRNLGLEMLFARSAGEALELLAERAEPVPVVVSDYRMPGVNGLDLLAEIGQRWPATAGILLSGYADIPAVSQALQDGRIFAFMPKPWKREELFAAIQEGYASYREKKAEESAAQ
jgi:two-component system, NtrC family, sensor kinase